MFTPELIKARLKNQPFVPFTIVTTTGASYEVRHPDLVWVGIRDLQVGIPAKHKPSFYSDATRIALLLVTELRDLPTESSSSTNGT